MVKDMFANAAILISFLFICGQFFKDRTLFSCRCYIVKIYGGLISGVLGILLIIYSIPVASTLVLDFRQMAIVVAAVYGGMVSSAIGGMIIGSFHLLYIGINQPSIIGAFTAATVSIGCGLISSLSIKEQKKWLFMIIYSLMVSSVVYFILIKDIQLLFEILLNYVIGFSILGILVYYYLQYIIASNKLIKKLREDATKDFLTGLNNVRSFDALYNCAVKTVVERKKQLSILIADIDFFKRVNDTYGHSAGDAILIETGKIMIKNCRCFDIVSRIGGEEFSILLMDCPQSKAYEIGERIRKAVEEHTFVLPDGNTINITISVGAATFPDTTPDKERLLEKADNALYKAKNTGRNKVCIF